jgi:hypothetical protein
MFLFIEFPVIASVKISPEKFDITVKPGKKFINGSFTIEISGQESVRYRVYSDYFEISDKGTIVNDIKSFPKNSIVDKIRFNPKEITVAPNIPQKIRFTIINLEQLPDGESRGVIFLEDTKTKVQTFLDKTNNVAANINLVTRIAVPIYVDNGKFLKSMEIQDFSVKQDSKDSIYQLSLKSLGNSKVRVCGKIQVIKDKKLVDEINIENRPVQGGAVGLISGKIPTENLQKNTDYILRANLTYLDENSKEKHVIKEINFLYSGKDRYEL